ncbi:histidine phosphatase family protein [Lactobacillus acetotolerans]|uniref:Histidine phosphatase family protein n=1 Tax=Lactobacillus acetotolerans TaxID=1600 RepID=A0A5P5ZK30_9LACO|nr:histidine phosphatase family protein [Lactobacillus acetotolerans]KRN41555.1 phosphoglycerate mutase [Lactobacillus acetotolerans DSM 20749 = JCM 3825]QFG51836.1 histidine phosphatase family protein [Lactobacillus acetotolerans]GGV10808.1 phosphoglycerate mutase [Lactobacillus acetotolerans DSM 20749 = JCM 3825]
MEIVFVRHGQTDLNKSNCIQGASVNQSLNEEGRKYAEKAAKNFDSTKFNVVYSSPLNRAVETAKIFTKGKKDIILDKRLIEFDFGEWDGLPLDELKSKYPDTVDPWGKVAKSYIKYAPHGESYEHLDQRCGEFLDEMAKKYPNGKVLVVCHGRLIRMMAAHYLANGDMDRFDTIDNCALVKFYYRRNTPRLKYYNKVLA